MVKKFGGDAIKATSGKVLSIRERVAAEVVHIAQIKRSVMGIAWPINFPKYQKCGTKRVMVKLHRMMSLMGVACEFGGSAKMDISIKQELSIKLLKEVSADIVLASDVVENIFNKRLRVND